MAKTISAEDLGDIKAALDDLDISAYPNQVTPLNELRTILLGTTNQPAPVAAAEEAQEDAAAGKKKSKKKASKKDS